MSGGAAILESSPLRRPGSAGRGRMAAFVRRLKSGDAAAHALTLIFAASVFLITFLLVDQLYLNSALPRHKFGSDFFFTRPWAPVFENFGALPFISAPFLTPPRAFLLALPLGVRPAIVSPSLLP